MKLSTLTPIKQSTSMTDVFGGINQNLRIAEGEFNDMKNMSSDMFPVLSPRDSRETVIFGVQHSHVNGIIDKDGLCYVLDTKLYVNGVEAMTVTDTQKQLISMGAYIIVMPDKKFINTKDTTDQGVIEQSTSTSGTVSFELCKVDGTAYSNVTVSATEPTSPTDKQLWIDTSIVPHTLKEWSTSSSMWIPIATTYVKIKANGIASGFNKYDGVYISGITVSQLLNLNDTTSTLQGVHVGTGGTDIDYIIVTAMLDQVSTQSTSVTISRRMPTMDFIIESENRLWGCRYGLNNEGKVVNEIYASKLGDFKNWNTFMGISSDSYTVSVGTDGAFTGAVTHMGFPTFFKENCMHRIYGNYPSNYQVQTTACRGVQKGAGNSLALVNEKLFYKSLNGVCYYDGSLPIEVSDAFGGVKYSGNDSSADTLRSGAVAGSWRNKYYISMKSEKDGQWHLFVFDSIKGMWHREDNSHVQGFAVSNGHLYFIDKDSSVVYKCDGGSEKVDWMVETGMMGTLTPSSKGKNLDHKYISRLNVRMKLDYGSRAIFYIQYDSSGEWLHVASLEGTGSQTFNIPLCPKRCDHFKLKIEGEGKASIIALTKTIEQGGE